MLVVPNAAANEYQNIFNFEYINIETVNQDYDIYGSNITHFFSAKESIGPFAEFDYINKQSNIFGNYADMPGADPLGFGGEYISDSVLIGASYTKFDDRAYLGTVKLGYFVNEDFLVQIISNKTRDADSVYQFAARYNHQLENNDYLGFSFRTDENFDNSYYSATYFSQIGEDQFLKSTFTLYDFVGNDGWNIDADYYFSQASSVSFSYDDDETFGIGGQHFFNENYAVYAKYSDNDEGFVTDTYQIGFRAQL